MGSGLESLEGARARMPALLGGRPCLDFANTVDPRYGDARREYLTSYADLVAWSRVAAGMGDELAARLALAADRDQEAARSVLDRALRLREALHRLFSGRPGDADLATLNGELAAAMGHAGVLPAGPGYAWTWPETEADLSRPLWPVARSAAELLSSPELERVKECLGERCGWLFLDTTKNHRRTWCSMEGCGNRAKARRHYARRRTAAGQAGRVGG